LLSKLFNKENVMPLCIHCNQYVEDNSEAGMTKDFRYYHPDCGKESAMDKWDDLYYNGDESFTDIGET